LLIAVDRKFSHGSCPRQDQIKEAIFPQSSAFYSGVSELPSWFLNLAATLLFKVSCVEYTLLGDSLSSMFPSAHLVFTGINLNTHNLFATTMALAILLSVWFRNLSGSASSHIFQPKV